MLNHSSVWCHNVCRLEVTGLNPSSTTVIVIIYPRQLVSKLSYPGGLRLDLWLWAIQRKKERKKKRSSHCFGAQARWDLLTRVTMLIRMHGCNKLRSVVKVFTACVIKARNASPRPAIKEKKNWEILALSLACWSELWLKVWGGPRGFTSFKLGWVIPNFRNSWPTGCEIIHASNLL